MARNLSAGYLRGRRRRISEFLAGVLSAPPAFHELEVKDRLGEEHYGGDPVVDVPRRNAAATRSIAHAAFEYRISNSVYARRSADARCRQCRFPTNPISTRYR